MYKYYALFTFNVENNNLYWISICNCKYSIIYNFTYCIKLKVKTKVKTKKNKAFQNKQKIQKNKKNNKILFFKNK